MLSKEQKKEYNKLFWTGFQKFIGKTKSSNGRKINWINYPADAKHIFIRLEADAKAVRLCMDIQPKDESVRAIIWEQMTELKAVMDAICETEAIWNEHYTLFTGQVVSRIYWENQTLNFYKPEDQEKIYSYLKERLTKFDLFYQEYKEILIALIN